MRSPFHRRMRARWTGRFALLTFLVGGATGAMFGDPVGTWRGRSTCHVRPSTCRDEVVVYRITRTAGSDSLSLDGRKVVDGDEVEMGVLACSYDAAHGQLTCPIPIGVWRFTMRGDRLDGELRRTDGTMLRTVSTRRG